MDELLPTGRTDYSLFTTAEAQALGVTRKDLSRLRRGQHIESVCRGVYARGVATLSETDTHHRLACAGILLYPEARVSHASALILHDISVWPGPPVRVDLVRDIKHEILTQSFRMRPLHGSAETVRELPVCDVASSLIHFTMDAGATAGVIAADDALRRGLVDEEALKAAHAFVKGEPHSGRCRMMTSLVDGRRESVGESRVGILARAAGIHLIPQVQIFDLDGELVARVDFVVEGTKIVVEFDGKIKYTDGGPDALFAEKRREDRLRRLGYTVIRVTWADLEHPQRVVAWIRSAMLAA